MKKIIFIIVIGILTFSCLGENPSTIEEELKPMFQSQEMKFNKLKDLILNSPYRSIRIDDGSKIVVRDRSGNKDVIKLSGDANDELKIIVDEMNEMGILQLSCSSEDNWVRFVHKKYDCGQIWFKASFDLNSPEYYELINNAKQGKEIWIVVLNDNWYYRQEPCFN